jgi:predicted transcriptional regulator
MSKSKGSEKQFAVIAARVPREVAEKFDAIAKRNHRSRSAEAALALTKHMEREAA